MEADKCFFEKKLKQEIRTGIKKKSNEIYADVSAKILKEYHQPLLLIFYSFLMTVFVIIIHWKTFINGFQFFPRVVSVITGFVNLFSEISNDTASLVIAIVICVVVALFAVYLALKLKRFYSSVKTAYAEYERIRAIEATVFVCLCSFVLGLAVSNTAEITWITVFLLGTVIFNCLYHGIATKNRQKH